MASNPTWAKSPDELPAMPRNAVHAMVEGLIQWLDETDGDPDLEEEGIEDSFEAKLGEGAGCDIDDPGGPSEDIENTYTEWHTRGRRKLFAGSYEAPIAYTAAVIDDAEEDDHAEEDDPGGGNVTDEPHDGDDEGTRGELSAWPERIDQTREPRTLDGWLHFASIREDEEDDDPGGGNVTDGPHDPEEDRCLAGDDGVYSGAVMGGGGYQEPRAGEEIGSEDDAEPAGDEKDGNDAEDESLSLRASQGSGPGCPIGDPDYCCSGEH